MPNESANARGAELADYLLIAEAVLGVAQLVWILAPRLPEPEGMAKRTRDGHPDSLL